MRALEFLLGDVKPRGPHRHRGLGGIDARARGRDVRQALGATVGVGRWRQEMNPTAARVTELTARVDATQRRSFRTRRRVRVGVARATPGARWIAAGGSTPLGVLGHVNAGLELVDQIDAGVLPRAGDGRRPARHRRHGGRDRARVRDRGAGHHRRRRARRAASSSAGARACSAWRRHRGAHRADRRATRLPRVRRDAVHVAHDAYGGAYGRETHARAFRRPRDSRDVQPGIDLDATYSAKAFEVALDSRARDPTLFWLTFDSRTPAIHAMTALPEVTFHIYPTDCDMLGHLNHATMLNFLERARWALLEPQIDIRHWAKQDVFSVVRHVDIGYLAQSLPGEDLVIRSGLLAVKRTSFIIKQEVRKVGSNAGRRGVDRVRGGQPAGRAGAGARRVARNAAAVAGAGVIALVDRRGASRSTTSARGCRSCSCTPSR